MSSPRLARRLVASLLSSTLVLAALAGVASPLAAQGGFGAAGAGAARRPLRVVVSGGLTLPSGDLADFHDSGFHYDASLLLSLAGFPIALRPEVSLTNLKLKDVVTTPTPNAPGYGANADATRILSLLGNVEIPLAAGLYAIAGLGAAQLKVASATSNGPGDVSETKLAFDAGAGFRFHLGRIDGFVEGRVGSASYEKGKFGFSQAQFIPISFGLVF